MLPRLCCSPQAGEPLWTGQVAGEPFKSVSITAEAGKLPTFNVRPFWPFQVVELGLRKEGEKRREWRPGSHMRSVHKLCAVSCICLEEGKPFSPQHKRAPWAPGGRDWWSSRE